MTDSYTCASCNRKHRADSVIGKLHLPPPPPFVMPSKCPRCGGALVSYPTGRWCPAEDPHAGGVFIRLDGTVRQRSIIGVSTTAEAT